MEVPPGLLDELRATVEARALLEERMTELVRAARESGESWRDIAGALGVAYQSAHARYRWLDAKQEDPGAVERRQLREDFKRLHGRGPYASR